MIGRLNINKYLRHVRRVSCREITSQNVDLNEPRPWHRLLETARCEAYIDAKNRGTCTKTPQVKPVRRRTAAGTH